MHMTWNPLQTSLGWLVLHTSESRTQHEDDESIDLPPFRFSRLHLDCLLQPHVA